MDLQPDRPIAPAIATLYSGTLFRSRLEARWAAFFDFLKWPWAYEALDLDWYIPDFLLRLPAGDVAVEVKPSIRLQDLHGHAMRAVKSGWNGEVLALGAVLFDNAIIGLNAEPIGGGEHATGAARLFRCISCNAFSFLNDDFGWRCRVNGCYGGNAHIADVSQAEVEALWAEAGNRVQWRPAT